MPKVTHNRRYDDKPVKRMGVLDWLVLIYAIIVVSWLAVTVYKVAINESKQKVDIVGTIDGLYGPIAGLR